MYGYLQAMDGEVYDKFRDAYTLYAQIEVDCANYVKANFEDLRDQASLVRHYKQVYVCRKRY